MLKIPVTFISSMIELHPRVLATVPVEIDQPLRLDVRQNY